MSIPFSGTLTRSGGILAAVGKQIRLLNLKGVKRVTIQFDPFHENAKTARDFLFALSTPKVSLTNPSCLVKTDIVCNREQPLVTFLLTPTVQEATKLKTIKIQSENLTFLELLRVTNEQVSARAPKEEKLSTLKTKSEKKASAGKRR